MNLVERKEFTEILLVRSLIENFKYSFSDDEIVCFINDNSTSLHHDDFYFELIELLKTPDDSSGLLPIFICLKIRETLDLIHRRLFNYNSEEFYWVVIPIIIEFCTKYKLRNEKSEKSILNGNGHNTKLNIYLRSNKNQYQLIKSNVFFEDNIETYNLRFKKEILLYLKFIKLLYENVYLKIGRPINTLDLIHKKVQIEINNLGVVYNNNLTKNQIDDLFFLLYFKDELKQLYKIFCLNPIIGQSNLIKHVTFYKDLFQHLNILVKLERPKDPLYEINLNPVLKFNKSVQIVERKVFFSKLWGIQIEL